ncbi:hypothetical protein Taro_034178 [Colocasia esculenta]|uniref:non-specific serine/threonine protein kinase n=1 Tax=Colocasia esculenta TaxID=4460 RepID=A0A843W965_COLES|nr:hypothetical protein [Colocasia esculenta]
MECCFKHCYFHGKACFGVVVHLLWFVLLGRLVALADHANFTFNGFRGANLSLAGSAASTPDGILRLTDAAKLQVGHAFYPLPLPFGDPSNGSSITNTTSTIFSFSSNFVFAVLSPVADISGHGIAFLISPSTDFSRATGAQYLGLFNTSSNGDPANHIAAVELDMIQNADLGDINDNHVGIDINSLRSVDSFPAGYYRGGAAGGAGSFDNLSISSGNPMQLWVEYNGAKKQLNVTLSPMGMAKPSVPLLSSTVDLSNITRETMYVGFSASTGTFTTSHVILGWSFVMDGTVQPFELSNLPSLPRRASTDRGNTLLVLLLSIGVPAAVLAAVAAAVFVVVRRRRFSELLEDWEQEYGPQRFSYKDLYRATKGFRENELLGAGGFGKVYSGVLPTSNLEVAIKKVCHESKQGIREFIAEVVTIGRLRHRCLVQLLGYCRRKGELLLVYEFMANGSLDRFLFDQTRPALDWSLRYRIIKDVASGLLYLHEEWEQVVVHRDIKASNVLLDGEFNGKVGDFGLARLYDHKTGPQTTHVVGTMGYIAPELTSTSKATTETDVFAFGAFLLEVACGRRPIETQLEAEEMILVEWVLDNWKKGEMMRSVDPRLSGYAVEEVGMVLMLGLLCSHPSPRMRPSMRLVTQILDGDVPLPVLSSGDFIASFQKWQQFEAFDNYIMSYPSSIASEKPPSGSDNLSFN